MTKPKRLKASGTEERKPRPKAIRRKAGPFVFASPSAERNAAIERIVRAVGREPDNRDSLAKDIDEADIWFVETLFWKRASAGKSIESIRKALKRVVEVIESDPTLELFFPARELKDMLKQASSMKSWQGMRRRAVKLRRGQNIRQLTPLDWLARTLSQVYERRFGSASTWSWHEDEPRGAVIDFIEAVLKELLESECSRKTISRAFSSPGKT
jgi:hypothetical protein